MGQNLALRQLTPIGEKFKMLADNYRQRESAAGAVHARSVLSLIAFI